MNGISIKTEFINVVDEAVSKLMENQSDELKGFWEDFKKPAEVTLTDNGKKVLAYMQETFQERDNLFKAKDIAEGLFVSSRSITGTLRKMVNDGFVEKVQASNPIVYGLTDKGKEMIIE